MPRARVRPPPGQLGVPALLCCAALAAGACGARAHDAQTRQAAGACANCHLPEYQAAKNPPHAGVRPTACAVCHTQQAWRPSVFDHPYPLLGAHAKARCAACHVGQPPVYAGTSKQCVGCHRDDYDRSEYPGHDRFATTCDDCHSTTAWKPARKPQQEVAAQQPAAPPPQPTARGKTAAKPAAHKTAPAPSPPSAAKRPKPAGTSVAPSTPPAAPQARAPQPSTPPPARAQIPAPPSPVHPENRFPIKSGAHEGIGCRTCHDQGGTMGKNDTDCVQCHKRAKYDDVHARVRDYPRGAAAPNFCLNCHATGRRSRTR